MHCDISIPFGLRWGAWCCSNVTNAICDIMFHLHGSRLLVYIDDFIGINKNYNKAVTEFNHLSELFKNLGVQEATHKAIAPCREITWLGLQFDTINLVLRMPQSKIKATMELLRDNWLLKQKATRKHLQQLLGRLLHISYAVKPARLFVSRMLETLRSAPAVGYVSLSTDFKLDVNWFLQFLPVYNGIHMMVQTRADFYIEVDSCLSGCGGICGKLYYHSQFPDYIMELNLNICQKEMLNILVAVRLFASTWQDMCVQLFSDNSVSVAVLNSGRSRDSYLLACARQVWFICAKQNITLLVGHKAGVDLHEADCLSREHLSVYFENKVKEIANSHTRLTLPHSIFHVSFNVI